VAAEPIDVVHARGCPVEVRDTSAIPEAVALAAAADVAIVVVGDQSGIFEAATVGEAVESATCELPGVQRQLVEAVVASGTPTVVVLVHGRPFVLDWMAEGPAAAPAILSAWFPGEEGGHAVASVLFGDTAPGGRLPVSFPRHAGVAPAPYNRTFTRQMSYFDRDVEPVFPFGHGLSYTTMDYGDLRLSAGEIPTSGVVAISCTVRNTGARDADEVVQLYTRDPVARSARPRRELKGFQRVAVGGGGAVDVTFELAADRLALWDPADGWVVEPGVIEIMIGSSSEDICLSGEIMLTGDVQRVGRDRMLVTPVHVASAQ
jgi:beta-glucosidase